MVWQTQDKSGFIWAKIDANHRLNLIDADFLTDLQAVCDLAKSEGKPVVLWAEDAFCAGLDLKATAAKLMGKDKSAVKEWVSHFQAVLWDWFTLPVPTFSVIGGHCIAGGMVIAAASDFRIATAGDQVFSVNEIHAGIPMSVVYAEMFRYAAGAPLAAEMVLSGRRYTAEALHSKNFIHEVVADVKAAESKVKELYPVASALGCYRASKQILQAPIVRSVRAEQERLDDIAFEVFGITGPSTAGQSA